MSESQTTQGDILRESLREIRATMSDAHAIRLHRAVSWLRCAEKYSLEDEDLSFITLWIAFNSCYAVSDDVTTHDERQNFAQLAEKLVRLDQEEKIYSCIWMNYAGFVRLLIDNRYVFSPFWQSIRDGNEDWKPKFEGSRRRALSALADSQVEVLLSIVMDRLYTLRNQIIHGGATWQSQVNRDQVTNGKRMLLELMPVFIELMFDESVDWGEIYYPVVD